MDSNVLLVAITTMLPVAELRGGIPIGVALGISPYILLPLVIIANSVIFFPIYFLLDFAISVFGKYSFVKNHLEKIHLRGRPYIEKYGIVGLAIFVGIPLPLTGVWTGSIIARLLGLDWKRSFLAIFLGVLIATAIVSFIVFGFLNGLAPLFLVA